MSDRSAGWYVDDRCTNCDVSRQLAPGLVGEAGGRSVMLRQPRDEVETAILHTAAFACHTRSIRYPAGRLDTELDPFPLLLDDGVHLCGHNATQTAGANSYLVVRPAGNLMIDTPRWAESLAARYERLGPVTDVLLTHRDHAAHGRRYADRFGARLWIHEGDLDAAPDADRVLRGTEPVPIADGVIAHPVPGHTAGSVLYVVDERYCFSGDTLYWSRTTGDVEIFESVTWYSIPVLAASLTRSSEVLRFERLLPGHGQGVRLPAAEMAGRLRALTARIRDLPPRAPDFSRIRW
ncbi:MBL fold metallo-hydrolase [Rhizohabitans arisaemae]|uniref:MBL fold metallo-hydrolase n=1 Tax=Rhizohabitans arisaemae TaxID=2720610 RepID=UPI0024B13CE7|nr:MBL fold metallo-hydrolase [Rhizohabitans arisaemae]